MLNSIVENIVQMKSINGSQLNQIIQEHQEEIQLIDVREDYEREICKLENDLHISLDRIPDKNELIARDKKVIIYCRSGVRSARAIEYLEENYHFENLYNLEGGILAWADQVDTRLAKY